MMRKYFFIVLGLSMLQQLGAQPDMSSLQDPAARKILDRAGEQARADYPLKVQFEYTFESLQDNQQNSENGTLVMQEDKFRLSVGESEIYCDGTTLWNHMESVNEVYVSDPEESSADDEFFLSNPADLFTIYEQDFKYRLTGEISREGKEYFEIDLFPNDLSKSYHTVKLLISKKDHRLYSAKALGKQGDNHSVILKDYQRKVSVTEKTFVFDPGKYPGIEIVDTRL